MEAAEQQARQQQAQMMQAEQASKVAKNLAGSPLNEDNALSALTSAR
jgi:hypothetical protein